MDIFELLALKGTRTILLELHRRGRVKYSSLATAVGYSSTASRALSNMETLGIVRKEVLQEKYRPVVYSLTKRGERLTEILLELTRLEESR